jgi:hypothetical protein
MQHSINVSRYLNACHTRADLCDCFARVQRFLLHIYEMVEKLFDIITGVTPADLEVEIVDKLIRLRLILTLTSLMRKCKRLPKASTAIYTFVERLSRLFLNLVALVSYLFGVHRQPQNARERRSKQSSKIQSRDPWIKIQRAFQRPLFETITKSVCR